MKKKLKGKYQSTSFLIFNFIIFYETRVILAKEKKIINKKLMPLNLELEIGLFIYLVISDCYGIMGKSMNGRKMNLKRKKTPSLNAFDVQNQN